MKKTRAIAAGLCVTLLISLFTGCANNTSGGTAASSQGSSETMSKESSDSTQKSEPTELTLWYANGNGEQQDANPPFDREKDYYSIVEKKFNITLKPTVVSSAQEKEALSILLSSNKLPDIMRVGNYYNIDLPTLRANKQLITLDSYKDKMPDYMKIVDSNSVIRKNISDADGSILFFCDPNIELEQGFGGGIEIRMDWLKTLGLDMPKTPEEFLNVMRAFRDDDPNGNGKKDEIPFVGSRGSLLTLGDCFGVTGVDDAFVMKGGLGGEIVFSPYEETDFKAMLKFMATMYQEKLINDNFLVMKGEMRDTWMAQGVAGSTLTGSTNMAKWNQSKCDDPNFLLWPMPGMAYNGVKYFDRGDVSSQMDEGVTFITTSCKNPEKAVEYLNYGYTEEGHKLTTFGVEGIQYSMDNGLVKFSDFITNNKDGLTLGAAQSKYTGLPAMNTYADMQLKAQTLFTDPACRQAILSSWTNDFDDKHNINLPRLTYTDDERTEYTAIMADVKTYLEENINKFITGTLDIEKDYPQFIKDLKSMKADRAVEINKAAVKRWQTKCGITYKLTITRADTSAYLKKIGFVDQKGIEYLDSNLK